MGTSLYQPKVFISYSWSSIDHEKWVLEFAERLISDGVDVVLDKWDLKEGQDKYKFMEQAVNNPNIQKVLLICDKQYQEKADGRRGGVGTETQLVSKEIYENVGQEKFIPIIREKDQDNKAFLPAFINTRIFIDLSDDESFEIEYEKLLRNVYGKPQHKKPSLGTPPSYVVEETQAVRTINKTSAIKNAILRGGENANGLIVDYFETFTAQLSSFRIALSDGELDEQVYQNISRMLPLRDDFISFSRAVFQYQNNVDLNNFYRFFEDLIDLRDSPVTGDNFVFFSYELMLYLVAILLKSEKYQELSNILHHTYFYKNSSYGAQVFHEEISIFNSYVGSLDDVRNKRLQQNRTSVTADTIKHRANNALISFPSLIEADMLLYYITSFKNQSYPWFPRCSIYRSETPNIGVFDRIISGQYFDKVKCLFQVDVVDQFIDMVKIFIERQQNNPMQVGNYHHLRILGSFDRIIDLNKVASIK